MNSSRIHPRSNPELIAWPLKSGEVMEAGPEKITIAQENEDAHQDNPGIADSHVACFRGFVGGYRAPC